MGAGEVVKKERCILSSVNRYFSGTKHTQFFTDCDNLSENILDWIKVGERVFVEGGVNFTYHFADMRRPGKARI